MPTDLALQMSSAATSGTGPQSTGAFYGGSVQAAPPPNNNMVFIIGAVALAGLMLWKR